MFGPVDFTRIQTALATARGWIELVLVLVCVGAAVLVARRLERLRAARASATETPAAGPDAGAGFTPLLFPLAALGLLFVARGIYRHVAPPFFLDLALPLALAFAGIRMTIYALRRLFPAQGWLPPWERLIGLAAWTLLVLYYVGVLPEIAGELDGMRISIGHNEISLLAVVKGGLLVLVTLVITLWLSGLLEQRLMAAHTIDSNMRVVLAKTVRAALLVVAVLLSLQAVGIDLTVLTVFGGAIGVGIGLGLQKLASNYIAGFTILLDRSIRLGDMITVDNRHGIVSKVTSRYVVVRSLDGVEAIVPNETLVTTTVLNHTYSSKDVRLAVAVQVSYGTDLGRALALMEEAAAKETRVLQKPGPAKAMVLRLADSGIDLELGFWITDPEHGVGELKSALLRRILGTFEAAGIEIPYPRRDLRLLAVPAGLQAAPEAPAAAPPPSATAGPAA